MVSIQEVIQVLQNDIHRRGIPYLATIKQVNNNMMVTCPYHKNGQEKSPSCGILLHDKAYNDTIHKAGTVHCFTCGATHTLEEMISHVYGYNDDGAYGKQWLMDNFQILSTEDISFDYEFNITPKEDNSVDYKIFKGYHEYFKTRGINEKVADAFDLGYDSFYNAVVLPLFDKKSNCIMLIKRSIDSKMYLNTKGARKTDSLFGIQMIYKKLPQLIDHNYVYIVEGPFDVLKMWQYGKPAVGILQASVSENQVKLIEKLPFQKIVIATDNDEAGRNVGTKLAQKLKRTKEVYRVSYPMGIKDPGDMSPEQIKNLKLTRWY